MSENKLIIPLQVAGRAFNLSIYGEGSEANVFVVPDALSNAEAPYQIIEGHFYEYDISPKDFCLEVNEIVSQSKVNISSGRIAPNIYVGTLTINILHSDTKSKCGEINIEVQSKKAGWRKEYRSMMEDITEKCNDLLLQHNSPSSHSFEVDHSADSQTLYQRFAFLKSILDTVEFYDSVHKIISSPVTKWKETETLKDIRNVKRLNASSMRQISSAQNRIVLPKEHPLRMNNINSVPARLRVNFKTETIDTPENRFIKYALISFQSFCNDFKDKAKHNIRLKNEATALEEKLEQYLSHSVFKEISMPTMLALNSPVLQRKEGYREILRIWLMADLAAKLVWHGGDEVYKGNKKDVATLYEYWLYFKLLDVIKDIFQIEPKAIKELIKETPDGLGLQLMQGKHLPLVGIYDTGSRKFNIQFSYNRTFSGGSKFPASGSWTKDMRPDYTLTIWPLGINQHEAEVQELIVHIHFDAKYKVDFNWMNDDVAKENSEKELTDEKREQREGTVKRVDLLKMHAYKDAIRRTGGAYVLYPGDNKYSTTGFHEILPGLGAFAIKPGKESSGIAELKKFLLEVVRHFQNRTSQREKMSYQTYETHLGENTDELNEALPETYGNNRGLLPDNTSVLVAFYKKENWDWIIKKGLYNARTEAQGALTLGPKETGAKYILLHSHGETVSGKLFKVTDIGPKVFSKQKLIKEGYPSSPSQDFYLVYKVELVTDKEFETKEWNISKLEGYRPNRTAALPFSVSLTELMKAVIKK